MMHRNPDWKNTGWGSRNGKAVRVSEVSRGLACECVCPGCGGQLVAKKGMQRAHHFAHANTVDCDGLGESALHLCVQGRDPGIPRDGVALCGGFGRGI